jgi:hypothetical protein
MKTKTIKFVLVCLLCIAFVTAIVLLGKLL